MSKHKAYLLEDQFSEQIHQRSGAAGYTGLGYKAPSGNVERWPTAGLPLDRLLIKVLTRSDFILSWKVSKEPLVTDLILSPSSHI